MSVQLYLGDCLDFMRTLPAGSVDAVVTDPPYGVTAFTWDVKVKQEWIDEILRVSLGAVMLFNAARPDIQEHMLGLRPRCDRVIIWRQPRVTAGTGMFWSYQPIYVWRGNFGGWDTIEAIAEGEYNHPTQKPVKVIRKLISMAVSPGATVLDPFMGSGTTGVACVRTGRNFIGCEIDPGYYQIAERRIKDAQQQPMLPLPELNGQRHEQVALELGE